MKFEGRCRFKLIYVEGTQEIEQVHCFLGGHNVTLVDTPGFDDSTRSDTEVLSLIARWLQISYKACVLS